jgi:hypothetical protein
MVPAGERETVPLQHSTFWWLGVRFNPANGRGRVHLRPGSACGFGLWTRFKWHVLWEKEGRLCFQVGRKQWFRDEGWLARVDSWGEIRTFRLFRGSEVAFKHTYTTFGTVLSRLIDVTWDGLDESLSDFFRNVADRWAAADVYHYVLDRMGQSATPNPPVRVSGRRRTRRRRRGALRRR